MICDLILLAAPEFPTFLQGEAAFLLLLASDEAIDPSAGQDRSVRHWGLLENRKFKRKKENTTSLTKEPEYIDGGIFICI